VGQTLGLERKIGSSSGTLATKAIIGGRSTTVAAANDMVRKREGGSSLEETEDGVHKITKHPDSARVEHYWR
jgi:hypothetical protein